MGSTDLRKELRRLDPQRLRQGLEHVDGGGILLPLDHADIIAVDAGEVGKLLLREAAFLPDPSQVLSKDAPECHGPNGSPSPRAAPPSILGTSGVTGIWRVPEQSTDQRFEFQFALAPGGDAFVASLTDAGTGDQIVALQLPRDLVTAAVLAVHRVALELRSNGQVAAFDRLTDADLATGTLQELFDEALEGLSPAEDAADLAELETMLEHTLLRVRGIRHAAERG